MIPALKAFRVISGPSTEAPFDPFILDTTVSEVVEVCGGETIEHNGVTYEICDCLEGVAVDPQGGWRGSRSRGLRIKVPRVEDQGPKDQGPKDQGPKDQGPKDQGPKDQGSKGQGSKGQGSKGQGPKAPPAFPPSRLPASLNPSLHAATNIQQHSTRHDGQTALMPDQALPQTIRGARHDANRPLIIRLPLQQSSKEIIMSDTATAVITAEVKVKAAKRTTEADLMAKYSHIVPGTLRYDEVGTHANKQTVEIRCRDIHGKQNDETKRIATSDLFQSFWTAETKDALVKARNKAKRALANASTREAALAELGRLDSPERARAEVGVAAPAKRVRKSKADAATALGL